MSEKLKITGVVLSGLAVIVSMFTLTFSTSIEGILKSGLLLIANIAIFNSDRW